jgi:tRNA 5-methylaminomethyl-2-thiouridine biosynthesis bifunctional protein
MQASNNASIEWRDGQPFAATFQDVYFSSDNGLLETDHVFLQSNDLSARWQQLPAPLFTIAETGFGTGLNFLCAVNLWLKTSPLQACLHFISVEKYPLSADDIKTALQLWPELHQLSEPFINGYAYLLQGNESVMLFDDRVKLTLLIGDATLRLKELNLRDTNLAIASNQAINAWFLDGFSPAKNPEMWQGALFTQMALLSDEETTFATFTSAGEVRRNLMAAGFIVKKRAGFGKKREMLYGQYSRNKHGW